MKIKTEEEARLIAEAARKEKPAKKQILRCGKRQSSVRIPHQKREVCSAETITTDRSTETAPLSISRDSEAA